ncbi:MAG: di-trans,poly-cis-decaprenylcistransferase, partial [Lachnospiraceae bacterium]|nr:di-trans,poly-cis-decaprenylcistransferase [Lachnospiraceae bacterium]
AQGSKNVEDMCEIVYNRGIEYFTVYAFSTENWSRPDDEVTALMKLLRDYMKNCIKRANKNNMKVRVIGDKTGLAEDLRESIAQLEDATKDNTGLKFTIAINYGSRDEITRAVRRVGEKIHAGELEPQEITEELIASELDTVGMPDPDLMIRTSGEQRISNFLLWQLAYTEFYFTPVYWPDFNKEELEKAIEAYESRDRRYGKI